MSKEEQEAIEYIKAFQKDLYGASEKNLMAIYIDRVWNYIDKLQKELEQEKEKNTTLEQLLQGNLYEMYLYYKELASTYQANCVSKDKIRDKIKNTDENIENLNNSCEFESAYVQAELNELRIKNQVLQELLGE